MFYATGARDHAALPHDPLKAIVAPRPIGWIASVSTTGALNLAPYSFFNLIAGAPTPLVMFSSDGRKDSVSFIEETGEFTCSVVGEAHARQMNLTSAPLPRGISEFAHAGLVPQASRLVRAPHVAGAPAALECRLVSITHLHDADAHPLDAFMVIGQVVGVHLDDACVVDGRFDLTRARPLARCGYADYAVVRDLIAIDRPGGA